MENEKIACWGIHGAVLISIEGKVRKIVIKVVEFLQTIELQVL